MERLGVRRVPEGNGEQRQIEGTTPTIKVKVIVPFRAQVVYCLTYFMGIVYCPLLELSKDFALPLLFYWGYRLPPPPPHPPSS